MGPHALAGVHEAFMKAINTLAITGAGLADVIRRLGSWAVLELHLPELGIRSRRRHADG